MKHLITAAASLMILMAFLIQFTHAQVLHSRLTAADQAVAVFHQTVKQEGCVSLEGEKKLKEVLTAIFGCKEDEITVEGTRIPVFRGMQAEYSIRLPVRQVVAAAGFWGLKEEENQCWYQVGRFVSSEYLGRER